MPYLANSQDQNKYAYYDFSKYKDDIAKVNGKALVEFLKQSGATSYLIASPNQIENLAVSSAEKQAGIVEKIRLTTSIEEMFLQGQLYSTVNRQYFMNSVLGLSPTNIAKLLDTAGESHSSDAANEAAQAAMKAVEEASAGISTDDAGVVDAASAMYQLYSAVNRQSHEASEEEVDAVYADAQDAAKKAVEDDEDYATSQASDVADQEDDSVEAESEDASAERQKILT